MVCVSCSDKFIIVKGSYFQNILQIYPRFIRYFIVFWSIHYYCADVVSGE